MIQSLNDSIPERDAGGDWLQAEQEVWSFLVEPESYEAQFQRSCDDIGERAVADAAKRERTPKRIDRLTRMLTARDA